MHTIAVLYPGDMGGHVAKTLIDNNFRVVSYLQDRSDETRKTAQKIGIEMLSSLSDVVSVSELVLSLVPPNAVIPVAQSYIAAASGIEPPARYIDMNAKSIATAHELSEIFTEANIPFTNASIIGRAAHVHAEGVICASGQRSGALEELLGRVFRVVFLGHEVAAATAFKMCFTGFNKTIMAAVFEIAAAANKFGITEMLFEEITDKMPGLIGDLAQLSGTYPRHLPRRRQEMEELSKMLFDASLPNPIALAAAETFSGIENRGDFDAFRNRSESEFLDLIKAIQIKNYF